MDLLRLLAAARDAVSSGARRLAEWGVPRARSAWAVVGLWLALGFLLSAAALWGFGEIADAVLEGATRDLDRAVLRWVEARHAGWLDVVATEATALGSPTVLSVLALTVAAFLWTGDDRRAAVLMGVATVGGFLLNHVLKAAFARSRPALWESMVGPVPGHSFPSGHAMNTMVVYVAAAYLLARLGPPTWLRRTVFWTAGVLVALVGASRVYLGVHYPSDVAAGFAVGWAWAMMCVFAVYVLRDVRAGDGG